MITIYPYEKLGAANHGWLQARHHFSFGQYYNPKRMHFGALRVINDDKVAAGKGFPSHPHDNMEIITFVRQGSVTHQDNLGNKGLTSAGDVQVMSAGSGVEHSEYNLSLESMKMYQIWIFPAKKDVKPQWGQRAFPKEYSDKLTLLVSGQPEHAGQNALFINQDAAIYVGHLKSGVTTEQTLKHQAYVLISKGTITLDGVAMKEGDGAEVAAQKSVKISATADAEVLVLDVPNI